MPTAAILISELTQAASGVESLAPHEASHLLDRSIDMIRDLLSQVAGFDIRRIQDAVITLRIASANVRHFSFEDIRSILLDAAEIIGSLADLLAQMRVFKSRGSGNP